MLTILRWLALDFPSPAAMPSSATIMGEVGNQVFELRNS